MVKTPDEPVPDDPESVFLVALWDRLELAHELSVGVDVISRVDAIRRLCDEASALIKQFRAS